MDNGQSDHRGARMEESGIDENIAVADTTSGDEAMDDTSGNTPFMPGKPDKYPAEQSNDVDPESMGQDSVEDGPQRTSTPPGAVSKGGQRPL